MTYFFNIIAKQIYNWVIETFASGLSEPHLYESRDHSTTDAPTWMTEMLSIKYLFNNNYKKNMNYKVLSLL